MKMLESFYDEEEITKIIQTSIPERNLKFAVLNFNESVGWVYISLLKNETDFSIEYSSVMTDTSVLIQFLAEIINLKNDIALFLDNEGSSPLLYSKNLGNNNIRFVFAHDYDLFLNEDIDEYDLSSYKIECDIIINKKILLKEFYKVLYPYVKEYNSDTKDYYNIFNLERGQKYLNEIKTYLFSN